MPVQVPGHLEPALPFLAPLALDQAVAASVRLALDQRDQWGQRGQWSLAMGCPLLVVLQGLGRQGAFPILVRPALVRQDLAYLEPVAWALVPPLVVLPLVVQPLVVQPLAVLLARVLYQRAGSGVSCHRSTAATPGRVNIGQGVDGSGIGRSLTSCRRSARMRQARERDGRLAKFVPSSKLAMQEQAQIDAQANEIFGVSIADDPMLMDNEGTEDDFDYWPDELVPLGVADDAEGAASRTTTSTTSETETTEGTEATDEEDDEDAWPLRCRW